MANQSDALAAAAMTPQELEAAMFADAYYGAEAKQEAAKFLVALGAHEEAEVVLHGLSQHLDTFDFVQKREVAEHFRRLGEICGNITVSPMIHLVPEPEAEPQPVPPAATDAIQPGDDQDEPEAEQTPVEAYKFRHLERSFLTDLFGEHNQEALFGLSKEQFRFLLDTVGEHYVSLKITRLNPESKQQRRDIMMDYIFERKRAEDIGVEHGVGAGAISLGSRKMIQSIRKRTEQELLDAMVADAVRFRPEPTELEEAADVTAG